jgi:Xaa-Pro aminopeptidase
VYARRLARLRADLALAGLDALVVTHPPNLRYLTGLKASAGAVVITRERCTLLVDFRYVTSAQRLAAENPELDVPAPTTAFDASIVKQLLLAGATRIGVEGGYLPVVRYNRLSSLLAADATKPLVSDGPVPMLVPTERVVERARAVKDENEITILREAAKRLSAVARELPRLVRPGLTELQIAALVEASLRQAGFEAFAFETIVASGPNAALPHARAGSRVVAEGDGVVLDFGGVYDGYCVDLTRTLQVGQTSVEFRRLFDAVAEAHGAAIAAVKPGVGAADIDGAARRVLEHHGLGEAFGHGTGHGLGLEVHEEPRISPLAPPGEPVVAGMVFTIEPGAYVPGVGGVQIEDDVLVVPDGCELLTEVPIRL